MHRALSNINWSAWVVAIAALLQVQAAAAQGPVRFEAVCAVKETLTDEPFEISFQLHNARVRSLDPPSFSRLVVRGPISGTSTTSINGRITHTETYSYYLKATKPGTYRIAPATVITTQGESLRSNPITVKVVQAKKRSNAYGNKVMITTEVSTERAVVGEQVNVDLRMYKLVDLQIERSTLVRQPSFGDAFVYALNSFSDRGEYVVIDGEQYYSQLIQRWAVFPNKPGKLVVEPILIEVNINEAQGSSGFLRPYRLIRNRIQTDSVEIQVQDMDGGPPGYEGAIGNYLLFAHLDKNTITGDDVVELTVRLQGQGNVKTILPPRLEGDARYFSQFDPTVEERSGMVQGLYGGVKDYKYVLTPRAEGEFALRPSLVFFDAQQRKFITIDTTLKITVQRGNHPLPSKAGLDTAQSASERVLAEEEAQLMAFRGPATEPRWMPAQPTYWWGSWSFWGLLLLPFLSLVGVWQARLARLRRAHQSEALRRQTAAGTKAQRHLQAAQTAMEQGDAEAFYRAIGTALLGFVKDRYRLSTIELTKQNVRQQLVRLDVPEARIDTLMALLARAEQARFAGLTGGTSMEETYRESETLLQALDA